ncbi:uncharacterized protein DUF3105 [Krasilnikovia cinnamomea]|uniref:Uncharacterized protein DUF3105 n=1 Tax=Krasilnikovia cinnamomea TaxID=349313 RepID=A0A4Q7ZI89_9ACTN|nr:DUF3105 domain-containing protein [Krasilnikovia cinnamomea]RZU49963.1 uncharacterized protein DUF3105 [Krasilnikovia cinnamomea]
MSISSPGPERNPSTVKVDKTSGQGKPPAGGAKPAAKAGGGKPGGGKPGAKGKGRKPVTPVKVSGGRSWGPIAVVAAVVLVAVGIIGFGAYAAVQGGKSWEDKAADIKGIVNYRAQKNPQIDSQEHKGGPLTYVTNPPVGGAHNSVWQNCMGDVYTEPIANEHAVHSLEHGAVWVTYKQGLPADQVKALSDKVEGKDYLMLSPVANLDKNVALQAWGYQLKVDSADDSRIDEFIKALRINATKEPGAACSGGNTATGPVTAAPNGTSMNK